MTSRELKRQHVDDIYIYTHSGEKIDNKNHINATIKSVACVRKIIEGKKWNVFDNKTVCLYVVQNRS